MSFTHWGRQKTINPWDPGSACETILYSDFENTNLAVKAQKQQHDKEEDGPEDWHWHHGHSFRVGNESQAGAWKENKVGMGRRGRGQN